MEEAEERAGGQLVDRQKDCRGLQLASRTGKEGRYHIQRQGIALCSLA